MKHFVLAFLLFLSSGVHCYAQKITARDIVEKALNIHTGGNSLHTYVLKFEHDKPGKMPDEILQRHPMTVFMDSALKVFPDSVRKSKMEEMAAGLDSLLAKVEKEYGDERQYFFTNLDSQKVARFAVSTNELKGVLDSTKMLLSWQDDYFYSQAFRMNPIALLQLMAQDSSKLNYIGIANIEGLAYHIVRIWLREKWISIYFDAESGLIKIRKETKIDRDPVFSQGSISSEVTTHYARFKQIGEFLLPTQISEIDDLNFYIDQKKLTWSSLNKPLPASAFTPVISDDRRVTFRSANIGNGLTVIERSTKWGNKRSLVMKWSENKIDLFTELENLDTANDSILKETKKIERHARSVQLYNVTNLNSVVSLSGLFKDKIHVLAPKGYGFVAQNSMDYSILKAETASGLLKTFSEEFRTKKVHALVIAHATDNSSGQMRVSYYLPNQKVIYFLGNGYSAKSKNAYPDEKLLYELIKSRNLTVEKIIFSAAYMDNAPLFMPFEEFEKRVLNTDFSIYKKWEK